MTTKRKRLKQSRIPGTEPAEVPDITTAAETYRDCRDERMTMQRQETEAHDDLLARMINHGLEVYEFEGYIVRVSNKRKASVNRKKDSSESNGEDDA